MRLISIPLGYTVTMTDAISWLNSQSNTYTKQLSTQKNFMTS